jgi:hypothetical protein
MIKERAAKFPRQASFPLHDQKSSLPDTKKVARSKLMLITYFPFVLSSCPHLIRKVTLKRSVCFLFFISDLFDPFFWGGACHSPLLPWLIGTLIL